MEYGHSRLYALLKEFGGVGIEAKKSINDVRFHIIVGIHLRPGFLYVVGNLIWDLRNNGQIWGVFDRFLSCVNRDLDLSMKQTFSG